MLKRLRIKFICILMSVVTAILCLTFGLLIVSTKQNLEEDSLRLLHTLASAPARADRLQPLPDQPNLPHFVLRQFPTGEIWASGAGFYDLSDAEYLSEIMVQVTSAEEDSGILRDHGLRYLRISTRDCFTIVCADTTSEEATIHDLVRNCVILGLAALLVLFGISVLLARWAVKPVDAAWQQQKQFVADASHELKTPLTVILTNAELLQNTEYAEQERRQFTDSILTMSHQMRGLVEGLLDLARIDNNAARERFDVLDLSQLAAEAVLPFEALFFEQEMELETQIHGPIFVKGIAARLQQVLDILLDNALKYASPQAKVLVTLRQQGHHCVLSVHNDGPIIPPEHLKNIFKRFYRVDAARQMNHSYGLGLSIADSIVREHRGRIWAESTGSVNSFHVQLPVHSS